MIAFDADMFGNDFIEISPAIRLSDTLRNDSKTRYRADKIINSYRNKADHYNVIICLTNDDISVPYKGKKDWGVLGLSFKGKKVAIASTYRLKYANRDFWKVVVHEFIHAYFNYGHCPSNDSTCIMQDAKGHANFANKNKLCKYCKKFL